MKLTVMLYLESSGLKLDIRNPLQEIKKQSFRHDREEATPKVSRSGVKKTKPF